MYIPIPAETTYLANVSGVAYKIVTCEQCRREYAYKAIRCAAGEATALLDTVGAQIRAQRRAENELKKVLEKAVEIVPCPACGWIQPDMQLVARQEFRWRSRFIAIFLLVLLIVPLLMLVGALMAKVRWEARIPVVVEAAILAIILLASGIGLLRSRSRALEHYDPNNHEDVEARIEIGKQWAVLVDGDRPHRAQDV